MDVGLAASLVAESVLNNIKKEDYFLFLSLNVNFETTSKFMISD